MGSFMIFFFFLLEIDPFLPGFGSVEGILHSLAYPHIGMINVFEVELLMIIFILVL